MKVRKVTLLLIPVVLITTIAIYLHFHFLDGLDGWFFSTSIFGDAFKEDTIYAEGYKDSLFRNIDIGMNFDEVLSILGPPLEKIVSKDNRIVWTYSMSPGAKSYRVRTITFQNSRVTELSHYFYLD